MKKLDSNKSFQVPKGYFDSLSDQIFSKIEGEKINFTEGNDFKVPEGYFDAFTDKVLNKFEGEETKTVPTRSLKRYYYIAASIAAVLLLLIGFQWSGATSGNDNILANSDIEDYFEFNGLGVSSYELAEMLPNSDLDINEILDFQLDNDNVIDYLNSNIEDLEELNLNNDD